MELMTLVWLVAGLALLTIGAEFLVKGAASLAAAVGISPLVIGLTVVAFGTSAPEMAVSVSSALNGSADIALGNVVGSNIFNVLFILGLSALAASLTVHRQLVRFDIPIMIFASLMVLVMGLDLRISRFDGFLLSAGIIAYTIFLIREARREGVAMAAGSEEITHQPLWKNAGLIGIGLVMLVTGSQWLVEGAVAIARYAGISELVIGLTIVAGGTSLPELATSVLASLRGQRDIAVGNILGSNIFNIGAVLGFSSVIAPDGIAVAPGALALDIPVMILVALVCLPVFLANFTISRKDGLGFLLCYIVYVVYLVMQAQQSPHLPAALPWLLTIASLCAAAWCVEVIRYLRQETAS